eukprot:12934104-Prorocentrum_lima.AAC.1
MHGMRSIGRSLQVSMPWSDHPVSVLVCCLREGAYCSDVVADAVTPIGYLGSGMVYTTDERNKANWASTSFPACLS